jgi:hypothetical protein
MFNLDLIIVVSRQSRMRLPAFYRITEDCKEGEVYVINDDGDLDYFAPYVFELVSSRQDDEMYILLGKMLESDNVPDHLPSWIAGYKAGRLKIGT